MRRANELASRVSGHTAIEAVGLGKKYRHRRGWALRDCTFRLPAGRVCALVGANGAGKTTLLSLVGGLTRPTEGTVEVLGAAAGSPQVRPRVAHLAQGRPLYPRLTVAETLRMGRELNPGRWDQALAERIVREGGVPFGSRVGTLSGGQRTRVALSLVLGKRAELVLLDEPLAGLDPLVRHEVLGLLLAQTAEYGTTVVLSSHLLDELDGVCDYLLLVAGGHIRVAGEVEDVIGAHSLLTGPHRGTGLPPEFAAHTVVASSVTGRQASALVRRRGPVAGPWQTAEPSLEELLLAYLRDPDVPGLIAPSAEPRPARLHRRGGGSGVGGSKVGGSGGGGSVGCEPVGGRDGTVA
ncbi:ABC transporter ATP-binding protein [Streptomyces sp. MST-110588]|nr:ABC transporter ATP-binding protein [Streptomyces sp. MST-110588]